MRITRIEPTLLRIPLNRPITAPGHRDPTTRLDHVFLLLVEVDTDANLRGLGFAYAFHGGRALKAVVQDDLASLLVGENPLDHERLFAKVRWQLAGVGRRGLVMQAYSAVDLALWDLKGKAANLPLHKLLGGAREAAPVYGSDVGWLWLSPEEIVDLSRPYFEQGFLGIKMWVGSPDPQQDANRVQRVREAIGEDVWFAVDALQRYDYATALALGHFLEEEIGVDWFEEPIPCEDVEGHARLAAKLEVPIAMGESLFGLEEFERYQALNAAAIWQPDVTRLGGLTPWLKVAALAERHHRQLAPHLMPEVAVHLACALPHVVAVEYMPWFFPAFRELPAIRGGKIVPKAAPGLGLELDAENVEKYRIA